MKKEKNTLQKIITNNHKPDFIIGLEKNILRLKMEVLGTDIGNKKLISFVEIPNNLRQALYRRGIITFNDLFNKDIFMHINERRLSEKNFVTIYNILGKLSIDKQKLCLGNGKVSNTSDNSIEIFELFNNILKCHVENKLMYDFEIINEMPSTIKKSLNEHGIYTIADYLTNKKKHDSIHNMIGEDYKKEFHNFINKKLPINERLIKKAGERFDERLLCKKILESKLLRINYDNPETPLSTILEGTFLSKLHKMGVKRVKDLFDPQNIDSLARLDSSVHNFELDYLVNILQKETKVLIFDYFKRTLMMIQPERLDILTHRSRGLTLEEIGSKYKLTREAIRQVIQKDINYILNLELFRKVILLLDEYVGRAGYISRKDLIKIFKSYTDLFILISGDAFISQFDTMFLNTDIYNELISTCKSLPEILNVESFKLYKDNPSYPFLKNYVASNYINKKNYSFKSSPTYSTLLEIIFENGFGPYRISNEDDLNRIKAVYKDYFGEDDFANMSAHSLGSIILRSDKLTMIGRGTYDIIHKDISDNLLKLLNEKILIHETISFKGLYEIFKEELKCEDIDNHWEMQGVIRKKLRDLYFSRDHVSYNPILKNEIAIKINDFINKQDSFFTLKQLKKEIPGVTIMTIDNHPDLADTIITTRKNTFIAIAKLQIEKEEINKIIEKVSELLDEIVVITPDALYELILLPMFHEFLLRNKIDNSMYAFNAIRAIFKSNFSFVNRTLSHLEKEYKSINQIIYESFAHKDYFELDELSKFINNRKYSINNYKVLLREFYNKGFMRIDNNMIYKTSLIQFPEGFVEEIEFVLLGSMVKGKMHSKQIESYEPFREISLEWNSHLLAHILMNHSKRIKVTETGKTYRIIEYIFEERKNV